MDFGRCAVRRMSTFLFVAPKQPVVYFLLVRVVAVVVVVLVVPNNELSLPVLQSTPEISNVQHNST